MTCEKLVFAINAWTPNFLPFLSRSVVLVSSDMIITEPIQNELQNLGMGRVILENSGNIGKNYRRHDEIGTPICITVDFETLDDDSVTVRDRDSMNQERVLVKELNQFYQKYFH